MFVIFLLKDKFFLEGLVLFFEGLYLYLFMGCFGVHFNNFHFSDVDVFLEFRLESLDKFVIAHDFAFEGILEYFVVLDLLYNCEVFLLVRLVLFGGVLVLVVGALQFMVHLNNVSFESD